MTEAIDDEDIMKNALKTESLGLRMRFEQSDWLAIEQKVSDFTQSVFMCLKEYSKSNSFTEVCRCVVLGEYFYCSIRKILAESTFKLVRIDNKQQKINKGSLSKKKIGMTADEIRFKNSQNKINKIINELISSFKETEMYYDYGFEVNKYLELRGITFMYCAWYIDVHIDKYDKVKKLEDVYELIIAIQKFVHTSSNYKGKSILNEATEDYVSKTMIQDLLWWLNRLLNRFPFDGYKLYEIAPKLIIFTKYDLAMPINGIYPRKNQMAIVETIKSHIENGFILSYKAMVASGKTTTASICIPEIIHNLNVREHAKGNTKKYELIACCNISSVKSQMAQTAYNAGIKFGIGYIKDGNVRIINHHTTKDSDRTLIICSPDVALYLLRNEEIRLMNKEIDYNKYWFFHDEPTIGADHFDSESLNENISVWQYLPPHTILSSATMCEFDKISTVIDYQKKKYNDIYIGTIYSNEIQIGCNVKTFDNERVLPHLNCRTCSSLKSIIKSLEQNPFLGRLYTTDVAKLLWDKLNDNKVEDLPDIRHMFTEVNNLSLDKVREICMKMLLNLSNTNDKLVSEICSTKIVEHDEYDEHDEHDNNNKIIFLTESKDQHIKFNMLGTYQSYRFMNMNLIVDIDPIRFTENNFKPLLDKLETLGITSASKLYANYEHNKTIFNKTINRLDNHIVNETKRSQQIQQITEMTSPTINFPTCCQINTLEHINTFASQYKSKINPKEIRMPNILETIPFNECNVPDWIMLLLFAGVGIYSPGSKVLSNTYNNIILQMASNGSLAYLISDIAICYGTNYPIYRVFITKEFAKSNSINTIFQLLGRAGRVGQSWSAEAFIDNTTAIELLKYVNDPESSSANIEANNIEKTFSNLLKQKDIQVYDGMNIIPLSRVQKKGEINKSTKSNKYNKYNKYKFNTKSFYIPPYK